MEGVSFLRGERDLQEFEGSLFCRLSFVVFQLIFGFVLTVVFGDFEVEKLVFELVEFL